MSIYSQKRVPTFAGRTDTEYILASVKEQEIQFERLTKELEEEHNTVAHQLERCKINQNEENNISFEEELEESDTESKRGSLHRRNVRTPAGYESKSYLQSPTLPASHGGSTMTNNYNYPSAKSFDARHSPVKMMQTQAPPNYSNQHRIPVGDHLPIEDQFVQHSYRPSPVARVEDPGSPPFPAYFSPPTSLNYMPMRSHHDVHHSRVPKKEELYVNERLPVRSHPNHIGNQSYYLHRPMHGHSSAYMYYPQQGYYYPTRYYPPSHQFFPLPAHRTYYAPSVSPKADMPPPLPARDSPFIYHSSEMRPTFDYAQHNHSQRSQGDYQNLPALSPVNHRMSTRDYHRAEPSHFRYDNLSPHQPVESTPVYHANDEKPSVKNSSRSASARPKTQPHAAKVASVKNDSNGEPDLIDVIRMLRHPSYEIVANAAAYLQHISFGNDKVKTIIREHGVLPLLVNLLHHHVLDVQQNACGALRNMVFGKSNDEAKLMVRHCGGVASLAHVLRLTDDHTMKELITGVLWNLSSSDQLKTSISDSAMPVLASRIIIYYVSMLDPIRMGRYTPRDIDDSVHDLTHSDVTIDPRWAPTFINATGCLRNISSAGVDVRTQMRSHEGLIEALLLVIENVIGKNDVDSKGVENCMCILRNLSYRLALEVESANMPISRGGEGEGCTKEEDCWRRSKKKDKKKAKEAEILLGSSRSRSPSQISIHGVEMLWQPGIARRYLALLAETCNPGTLEAATGALQNLSAGQWVWSENIRTAVRKEKGLPMLVEFLHMENQRVVTVMSSTLRNMALDERNKQLIGKHAMRDFVELLPEADYSSDDVTNHTGPDDLPSVLNIQNVLLYESVCCALTELVTDNVENATLLYEAGAIPKLVEISRGGGYRYPHRLVKSAGRVLATLWEYKNLRAIFKQHGWIQFHFNLSGVPSVASVGSQISPFSSPPLSPVDTSKETNHSPAYSKTPTHAPPAGQNISPQRPTLPYAPMSSSSHSAHPDANYVMMLRKDDKVLAESLV